MRVKHGPARVARVDRRVDLDREQRVGGRRARDRVDARDDALGHADRLAAGREADRAHDLLERGQPVGERELRVREERVRRRRVLAVELEDREVDVGAVRDDVRAQALRRAVLAHADVGRRLDDVRVREDAPPADAEARARALLLAHAAPRREVPPLDRDDLEQADLPPRLAHRVRRLGRERALERRRGRRGRLGLFRRVRRALVRLLGRRRRQGQRRAVLRHFPSITTERSTPRDRAGLQSRGRLRAGRPRGRRRDQPPQPLNGDDSDAGHPPSIPRSISPPPAFRSRAWRAFSTRSLPDIHTKPGTCREI